MQSHRTTIATSRITSVNAYRAPSTCRALSHRQGDRAPRSTQPRASRQHNCATSTSRRCTCANSHTPTVAAGASCWGGQQQAPRSRTSTATRHDGHRSSHATGRTAASTNHNRASNGRGCPTLSSPENQVSTLTTAPAASHDTDTATTTTCCTAGHKRNVATVPVLTDPSHHHD